VNRVLGKGQIFHAKAPLHRNDHRDEAAMTPHIQVDRERIGEFCRKNHMVRLAFFGSVLRKDFSPDSDVDVLVEFAPGRAPDFFLLFEMEQELSELIGGRKVDLVTVKSLNRRIRRRVLDEAETLYAEG